MLETCKSCGSEVKESEFVYRTDRCLQCHVEKSEEHDDYDYELEEEDD